MGRILVILNNVQLQFTHSIAYSYPLPLGRGILVDHWSTISRCYWQVLCILVRLQAWAWYDNTCQIQPVQRDRMPSGPTKYMSVFKCNHFEFKKPQNFWMHGTTCHHYDSTWPSNKSWHQIIINSHFMYMLFMAMGRSLLIFNGNPFKMSACQPYWIFVCLQVLNFIQPWISSSNFSGTLLVSVSVS